MLHMVMQVVGCVVFEGEMLSHRRGPSSKTYGASNLVSGHDMKLDQKACRRLYSSANKKIQITMVIFSWAVLLVGTSFADFPLQKTPERWRPLHNATRKYRRIDLSSNGILPLNNILRAFRNDTRYVFMEDCRTATRKGMRKTNLCRTH